MEAYWQQLLETVAQNPWLAITLAFVVSMGEALLVVGFFFPSTIVLVAIGSMVGLGKLAFWPVFIATAVGAVVGDAVSYWVGFTYRERLYKMWPFSHYANLLASGKAYFELHGGKSVVIGRFIPGVKSVVPGVAGMMGMSPARFTFLNVVSGFAWAAAHLLPAMSAGLAMHGLAQISPRLALMLGVLLVLTALLIWLGKHGVALGLRYLPRGLLALLHWGQVHDSRLGRGIRKVMASEHADFRLVLVLNLVVVVVVVGVFWLLDNVVTQGSIVRFDQAFSHSIQTLRMSWTDPLMLSATLLGDAPVVAAVFFTMLLILAWWRQWWLLAGVVAAFVVSVLFVGGMQWLVGASVLAFPSGHATISFTLLGLLAWFVVRGCHARWSNALLTTLLALMVTVGAFARIYLGIHWPSGVLAGWLFGVGILAIFAQMFRQETVSRGLALSLLASSGLALVLVGGWHVGSEWDTAKARYASHSSPPLALAALPVCRADVAGTCEEPFVLQWRGDAETLHQALQDWGVAPEWSLVTLNRFAFPDSTVSQLPVLPKLNGGKAEAFAWVKPAVLAGIEGRYVLRLYPQSVQEASLPTFTVWQGTLVFEGLHHPFGQLSLLWPPNKTVVCQATPLLLGLPSAQAVEGTLGVVEDGVCGGSLVVAHP